MSRTSVADCVRLVAQSGAEISEQRDQNILQRKIIIDLHPTRSGARVIGGR
jgi:hypothetical protein